ncbi:hypothetical protein GCM10011504_53420 [Siccirubricoccus deserti]|nr:hypothetical protein GCM10011504_53420 [Siccirubricoccus deserti]
MRGLEFAAPRLTLSTHGGGDRFSALRAVAGRAEWRALAADVRRAHLASERRGGNDTFAELRDWVAKRAAVNGRAADLAEVWRTEVEAHARAMLAHALSPHGQEAYNALFTAAGFAEYYQWHVTTLEGRPEWGLPANAYGEEWRTLYAAAMTDLMTATGSSLRSTISRLRNASSLFPRGAPTMLMEITRRMMVGMAVVLIGVPYEDILRERAGLAGRAAVPD